MAWTPRKGQSNFAWSEVLKLSVPYRQCGVRESPFFSHRARTLGVWCGRTKHVETVAGLPESPPRNAYQGRRADAGSEAYGEGQGKPVNENWVGSWRRIWEKDEGGFLRLRRTTMFFDCRDDAGATLCRMDRGLILFSSDGTHRVSSSFFSSRRVVPLLSSSSFFFLVLFFSSSFLLLLLSSPPPPFLFWPSSPPRILTDVLIHTGGGAVVEKSLVFRDNCGLFGIRWGIWIGEDLDLLKQLDSLRLFAVSFVAAVVFCFTRSVV